MRAIAYALAAALMGASAALAAWPERPVQIVVPFAAGGITDVLARVTAESNRNFSSSSRSAAVRTRTPALCRSRRAASGSSGSRA